MSREYTACYPENPPAWYWKKGLHDAGILNVESIAFPFDYHNLGAYIRVGGEIYVGFNATQFIQKCIHIFGE